MSRWQIRAAVLTALCLLGISHLTLQARSHFVASLTLATCAQQLI